MALLISTAPYFLTTFLSLNLFLSCLAIGHEIGNQNFIVQVQNDFKPLEFFDIETWYMSILNSIPEHDKQIIHVYKTVFHGFSTSLTPQQLQQLKKRPEIIGVMLDRALQLLTTRSPQFLGLTTSSKTPNNLLNQSNFGSNVTIAILDSGIWPERESFNDKGLDQIPSYWKGVCEGGEDFPKTLCNKKLIGVRYFNKGVPKGDPKEKPTARDTMGHGTHTASTAAGRAVNNASLLGYAKGVAVGMAEKARLAIYRVCSGSGSCSAIDILAGMDKAVEDGVNIISMSMGGIATPYQEDPIAIGSFGAMEKGVLVSLAAGNSGFEAETVVNVAPWTTTVGASTIDRAFPADLVLEDGTVITGSSLYRGKTLSNTTYIQLFYGNNQETNYCEPGSLKKSQVTSKIVVCDTGLVSGPEKGVVVKEADGVGVVSLNTPESGESLMAEPYMIPGLQIPESSREKLLNYINSTKNPRATMVFHETKLGYKPAPVVAISSSRGPNPVSNYILKPDVIAPGVNILAACPENISPSGLVEDKRSTEFIMRSGTSMSCPHVSGIAALLKGAHPDWSPAMIKSALMTTAYTHDHDGNPILDEKDFKETNVWGMGSGHVDPEKALDPGLVYDLTVEDYIGFLCASNYSTKDIKTITGKSVNCGSSKITKPWDLNYPAIVVDFDSLEVSVTRTVTYVSATSATYKASIIMITSPMSVTVTVDPPLLVFKEKGEKQSYKVRIQVSDKKKLLGNKSKNMDSDFGQLVWTDGKHQVTSVIVVTY